MDQPRVFISYSHQDEELKDEFVIRIKLVSSSEMLDVWGNRQLLPGNEFDLAIFAKIAHALRHV